MNKTDWGYCPICNNKTRTGIREDTEARCLHYTKQNGKIILWLNDNKNGTIISCLNVYRKVGCLC